MARQPQGHKKDSHVMQMLLKCDHLSFSTLIDSNSKKLTDAKVKTTTNMCAQEMHKAES